MAKSIEEQMLEAMEATNKWQTQAGSQVQSTQPWNSAAGTMSIPTSAGTNPYAGTNYHNDAINYAKVGDWDNVMNVLGKREEKVAATGNNYGRTSVDIYQELQDLYGEKDAFDYNTPAPTYKGAYDNRIDNLLNEILNRDDFSYDLEKDDLYQQYKTQYNREGNRAMNDTLASAASNAGGMNSYAITAAQQANDYYATQLGDKIPELYQLAYDMYLNDKASKVEDLGLLQDMDATQYNRYRDTMSDWRNDRDFAYNQYRDQVGDSQWQTQFDYNVGRDEISDGRYDTEWDYGVSQDEYNKNLQKAETLAAYGDFSGYRALGYTDEEIAKMEAGYQASLWSPSSGGTDPSSSEQNTEATTGDVPISAYGTNYSSIWGQARNMHDAGKTPTEIMKYLNQFDEQQLTQHGRDYILNSLNMTPTSSYGTNYSSIWGQARKMSDAGKTNAEIVAYLDQFNEQQLTDAGLDYILNHLNLSGDGEV